MFRVLSLLLLTAGCSTVSQPELFRMEQEGLISCLRYVQLECGMGLRGCGPEHSVEFDCVKDIKYLGQGPAVPADYAPEAQQ